MMKRIAIAMGVLTALSGTAAADEMRLMECNWTSVWALPGDGEDDLPLGSVLFEFNVDERTLHVEVLDAREDWSLFEAFVDWQVMFANANGTRMVAVSARPVGAPVIVVELDYANADLLYQTFGYDRVVDAWEAAFPPGFVPAYRLQHTCRRTN